MAAELNAKQMRSLLQSIHSDPQLKQSKDSILLAEDQYPESLDTIITRLTTPTTLQNTINLLQWDRRVVSSALDADLRATTIASQDLMRKSYELVPTADSPWDTYTFRKWKYFVTNICLSAVQDALKGGAQDSSKGMQHLFAPDRSDHSKGPTHNSRSNVQGLLLYNPILLDSPWQAPDDLDQKIKSLLDTNEPALIARSLKDDGHTAYDKDNALKQIDVLTLSIRQNLLRIYTLTSHSFHVLLRELIPKARFNQSNLFTHIKGARTEHMLNLRAHHEKTRSKRLPALSGEQLKPHSAEHTINFIEEEYVEQHDDAPHYTWSDILTATRRPRMSLFAWVDSFTLLTLRYGETVKKISKARQTKINRTVSKQITDEEKLTITTLHTPYSAIELNEGHYTFSNLVQLLAQNVSSFPKIYNPGENERIQKYLKTRASRYQHLSNIASQGNKGKGPPHKRQKVHQTSQRAWTYLGETAAPVFAAPPPYQSGKSYGKGKSKSKDGYRGKGKGKNKGKGRSKGKSLSFYTEKGKGKSKGKSKGTKGTTKSSKGKPFTRGTLTSLTPSSMQSSANPVNTQIKCHFCHIVGHIKPNCRKWLALSQSEQYQHRHSHETKYQLIYDHLEDSVLAPRYCQYCSDDACDGESCESPFDYDDYEEASVFFTQSLRQLVVNAKLDRPLDSHAPQIEQTYYYSDDAWGDVPEQESEEQWEHQEEYDPEEQTYEAYPTEEEQYEYQNEEDQDHDQDRYEEEFVDEDDQGIYE
jgi:hypothetical protein